MVTVLLFKQGTVMQQLLDIRNVHLMNIYKFDDKMVKVTDLSDHYSYHDLNVGAIFRSPFE